jgi:NAD(P)-dependent dehydrogenase (short-subunit alcohol dehydrogenase family)
MAGRVMVVTGGSRGIGAAIAARAARAGTRVAVLDLVAPHQDGAYWVRCDVGRGAEVRDALARVDADLGPVTDLVNNAGVAPPTRFDELGEPEWNQTLAVNLTGVFLCSSAALPQLRRAEAATITNVASIAGRQRSYTASAAYAAAKGGVIALTRQLAHELAPDGIRVNCVCPGLVDTEIMARNLSPQQRPALARTVPLGRFADPDEVASVVCFLASAEASYLTGAVVDVNGGLY